MAERNADEAPKEEAKVEQLQAGEPPAAQDARGGLSLWLAKPRVMWWIAVLVAILLVAVILVATLLTMDRRTKEEWEMDVWEEPGPRLMTIWPRPRGPHRFIRFRHGSLPYEGRGWPALTGELKKMLHSYEPDAALDKPQVRECFGRRPERGHVCFFDIRRVAPECSAAMNFGYEDGSPCVFLQFSNISGWSPEPYADRDNWEVLPEELRQQRRPAAFLDCHGDTLLDQENMGAVLYTPERGFRAEFFPYQGEEMYMAPLVAVQFRRPTLGLSVAVTCQLWARNINHTAPERPPSATVHFNLFVE
ncbi:sodium/potassium-transporting ATPase subunit beta-2-like [Ornithodoros turicata]|uniref:sodium/potassium-transporting ATPase subunit beta-2-like n=1 Tax=Ornithodoros turicata TaxID=34597 RepID=UPI00313973D5